MQVSFSVHSQFGAFTPVSMTCVREGEKKRDRAESETMLLDDFCKRQQDDCWMIFASGRSMLLDDFCKRQQK